ncbi:LysR family transcriptional regulator [Herbaspirillum rubrisubalbicans]|jgi:DNA-binding transcriptional LysR family regulator|uniref:LysR family transcriptional regulator n=2 Tax=Herbaspirillum rubrisubalbicans TaxID=80842 RepID=A0ABX9BVR2_9BURK|nr:MULTISPECIES: LysR family transcriptional regulator [Herbaspirillum]MCP1576644.1 DNA-binding transcriptional LysR family regulator [Herbaspirillum rubrisubalbicans]NQE49042.1 LysR family transcriptional regulator [Herbaspirillum rubrisubalbicans]QJP99886.1 LysR family transcriptional regulator [Herbaspirillum rubrisubalbicans Os34]RAM61719.1 LysR family transcriptional regulator [Herbaspirillum rubrisubalbicans]RAN49547.1 LysR family transcriptional regulator [Herbaspirillum rubrisubalbican
MDIRQLKYFVAVANTRNFTRASEQLHIAQPPLSRQIQLLEEELGVQLILRNSRPLRLTEAGRVFYEQALQILNRLDQLKHATQQIGLNQRQTLSIGFVASTLYGGLPMLVRKLRQHYPEVDIQLLELTSMQQFAALKSGRIDIGFGRIRGNDATVARTVLREERLVLAIPPAFPLATSQQRVSLKELHGQKLIVYPKEPRPSFADHILSLLNDQDIQPAEVHEVREIQTALGLVAAESGLCLIPASARLRNDLHYRLIDDTRATSPIILTHRINDNAWYIDAVKQLVADMYAEHPAWLDIETSSFPAAGFPKPERRD